MTVVTEYANGIFCWPELVADNLDAAKSFYSNLFNWEMQENPMGEDMVYVMAHRGGKYISAMYSMMDDLREQNIPTHWLSYVAVDDIDARAAKAAELGAIVHYGPADVPGAGRMAVIQEPGGAAFALWQGNKHIGAELVNEYGTVCWNELWTADAEKSGDFYNKLFGWTSQSQDMGDGNIYHIFSLGDKMVGGMAQLTEEMKGMPPNWGIYFSVDNCDASAEQAKSAGATIHVPPTDIPGTGRFSLLQDPQGAMFSIIKLEEMLES